MAGDDSDNGWKEDRKYVLEALKRNDKAHDRIIDRLDVIEKSVVILKVKAGVWGLLGGGIAVLIGLALKYFS